MPRKMIKIASYDIVSLATNRTVGYVESAQEVLDAAEEYRSNPDLLFVGIDESGYQVDSWAIGEVLNGTFEASLETLDVVQ